jgi:Holliday junction resolvasome RuvABC endonuclease subunit
MPKRCAYCRGTGEAWDPITGEGPECPECTTYVHAIDCDMGWDCSCRPLARREPNGRERMGRRGVIVVGFDPSLTAFGYAVVTQDVRPRVLRAGCVCTKPDSKGAHLYQADKDGARVDAIASELLRLLTEIAGDGHPFVVGIEAPAGAQHASTAKALGLSYGIARTVCLALGKTPITVQAHEVKSKVGGGRLASKDDVKAGVLRVCEWSSVAGTAPAREGETDAVGVAIATLQHPIVAAWGRS